MTDRELLELAAKATCRKLHWPHADQIWNDWQTPFANGKPWDPLTDDGDALRLLVELRIELEFFGETAYAGPRKTTKYAVSTSLEQDLLSATRYAIVRAAAEIGRTMP